MEIIDFRPIDFPFYSLSPKTAQMSSLTVTFNKQNGWQPHKSYGLNRLLGKCRILQILFLNGKPYTLGMYTLL
jgi:hypothetical protein